MPSKICRYFFAIFLSLFFLVTSSNAQDQPKTDIHFGYSFRATDFRWSIAGTMKGENPNILSELIYSPINSIGYNFSANYNFFNRFTMQVGSEYLSVYKGHATDIDYDGDNRTQYRKPPVGDTLFKSNQGFQFDFWAGLGYYIIDNSKLRLHAGIDFFTSTNRFHLLDDEITGLNSTYKIRRNGIKLFASSRFFTNSNIFIEPAISYLPTTYSSTANWNRQMEFKHPVSFIQSANAQGWMLKGTVGYRFSEKISIQGSYIYNTWKTGIGVDKLFLATGDTSTTRLNGAIYRSNGAQLNFSYSF